MVASIAIPVFVGFRTEGPLRDSAQRQGIATAQLKVAPYCGLVTAPSMPSTTRAYVAALTRQNARAASIDTQVRAHTPGLTDVQLSSDRAFITDVNRIQFPGGTQARAAALVATIHDYDEALIGLMTAKPAWVATFEAQIQAAGEARARHSRAVRAQLHLPANTCSFLRPG